MFLAGDPFDHVFIDGSSAVFFGDPVISFTRIGFEIHIDLAIIKIDHTGGIRAFVQLALKHA